MTSPGAEKAALSVRMRGIPEIVDNDWVLPTQGITVLTGRNNVGKTRLLQAIAALGPDAPWPDPLPHARIEVGDTVIELEAGPQAVLERYEVTGPGGSTTATWQPDPNNAGWYQLHIDDKPIAGVQTRGRWNSIQLPSQELAEDTLRRLTFVPAQRAAGPAPAPGSALGRPARRKPGHTSQGRRSRWLTRRAAQPYLD